MSIGGEVRRALAALDAATGVATDWNPKLTPTLPGFARVQALAVSGSSIYVGGSRQLQA
jgi:hypothetical protein